MRTHRLALASLATTCFIATLACVATSFAQESSGESLRRTILLKFTPETTPAEVTAILTDTRKAISGLEGLHRIYIGPQVNEISDFTHGISMDFDDETAFKRYRASPKRQDVHNRWVHRIADSQITDLRNLR